MQALKGNEVIKGGTRTAIDHLIDIFKGVAETKKSDVDDHRARMNDAASMKTASEEVEVDENWIEPDDSDIGDDDLRTNENVKIVHPTSKKGPHLIENDQRRTRTRSTKRLNLLTAVDISGSCPIARQPACGKFLLKFLTDFAGSVLDAQKGELLEYRHVIKRPEYKDEWG